MAKRTEILNYLAHALRQVRGYTQNQANAISALNSGSVETVTVDVSGFFYRGASVAIESPGIVRANAIAVLSGDGVGLVTVDVPGGIYNEFIALLSELGFVLETQSGDALGTEQLYIPAVSFIGGGGAGANGYATVNAAGSVTSITIDAPGSGYSSPPEIVVELPATAIAPATAQAHVVRGRVESIDVIFGSHSYTFTPNVLISASSLQFSTSVSQVHRNYRYFEDINDFPTICFGGTPKEDIEHYGAGQQLRKMRQSLRGYTCTFEESSIDSSEALARDIEIVVENFAYLASNLSVYGARVTSISTDEGLLSPYGICDVELEIDYVN